jgi:protein subunit release factor A
MYIIYCESEGWDYELTDIEKSDLEGIRHAAICINNSGMSFQKFSFMY